jgi:hypothetical protein
MEPELLPNEPVGESFGIELPLLPSPVRSLPQSKMALGRDPDIWAMSLGERYESTCYRLPRLYRFCPCEGA